MKFQTLRADYIAKRQAHAKAAAAEIETREAQYAAAIELRRALEADAADQIGTIITTTRGEARVERVSTHATFADVVHPIVSHRIKAGLWGKSVNMVYEIGFDHETRTWRAGKRTEFQGPSYLYGGDWEWVS